MRIFIKTLLPFSLFPILYFGINCAINIYQYSHQQPVLASKNILIMGDSHPKLGLDPRLFNSAQNLAQLTECYPITYWKLKKILTVYIPDTLILGYGPHNLGAFNDRPFTRVGVAAEMFKRYYPILRFNDINNLMKIDYRTYYNVLFREIAFFPKKDHIHYLGSNFYNEKSSQLDHYERTIHKHYVNPNGDTTLPQVSIQYLDSILTLCKEKHITPILTSPPVYKAYFDHIPGAVLEKYYSLKSRYQSQAIFIDRTQNYYPDSLMLDVDHVNLYGAQKFTNDVIDVLKNIPHP